MARPSRPWFRFYVEATSDRKLRRLSPAQRWLWVAVLSAARQSTSPGCLLVGDDAMTVDDLADVAGMNPKDVRAGMRLLEQAGMVSTDLDVYDQPVWRVVKWEERQFDGDSSADRTRKWRHNAVTTPSQERPNVVTGDVPPITDTETETDRENEYVAFPDPEPRKAEAPTPDGFADFWSSYPLRDGRRLGKAKAHLAWKRIPASKRPVVMAALSAYNAADVRAKDAERWLRPGVWDEWIPGGEPDIDPDVNPMAGLREINGRHFRHSQGSGFIEVTPSSGDYLE